MRYYKFANVSHPRPHKELNFGMYIERTMCHTMPRPKALACTESEARKSSAKRDHYKWSGISSIEKLASIVKLSDFSGELFGA